MKAEGGGLGRVDKARGIVGAHLEDDAHFEFAERLSAHEAIDVIEGVHGDQDVKAVGAAFANEIVELRAGIGAGIGAGLGAALGGATNNGFVNRGVFAAGVGAAFSVPGAVVGALVPDHTTIYNASSH